MVDYQSVWIEDNNKHVKAELLIEKNVANKSLYKLYWHEPNNRAIVYFEGSGMLFDNVLVGAYWDLI